MTDQPVVEAQEPKPLLDELFNTYATARIALKKVQAKLKAKTKAHDKAIAAARLTFKEEIAAAKLLLTQTKDAVEVKAVESDISGRFVFENKEWIQRNTPGTLVQVVDIEAFLKSPLAPKLISSVLLKQDAAQVFADDLPGTVTFQTESFKYHIEEKKHE